MSYVVECEQCGVIERGDLDVVGDAAEDHDRFHDVRISRIITDSSRSRDESAYYVLDEDRTAVIGGPFRSKQRASAEARDCGPNHVVLTEDVLS